VASTALNESGTRKAAAQLRAQKALQSKLDAANNKLARLEAARINIENKKLAKADAAIKLADKNRQRIEQKQLNIFTESAKRENAASERARAKIKISGDVILAKQQLREQTKLASKSSVKKPTMAILVKKITNSFAKGINNTRKFMNKQKAAIKLPKFTTRSAVHTGAGCLRFSKNV
ncbi:MAG: hypothetical protein EB127_20905, partial [Alphaproteobacteria bacterium]|nr:hypothetical protein [Alphaproteobacteria bacterium]